MVRVLIADDSPTARQLIAEILSRDPDVEIIGVAVHGAEAVRLTRRLRPDLVTMDIHMPELNGLDATREIMATCPTPIVIISSSVLINDVQWALAALQAGALTMLRKPPGPASSDHLEAACELVETIKAMAAVKVVRRRPRPPRQASKPAEKETTWRDPPTVAIAASTGGPPTIKQILMDLPGDFPAPILLVQHIARGFTNGFVAWLDEAIRLHVRLRNPENLFEAVLSTWHRRTGNWV